MTRLLFLCAALITGSFALNAQSLAFSHGTGVDMQLDVATDPALSPTTGLTLEAWIQFDETAVTAGIFRWPTIARMNPTPGAETYMMRIDSANTANLNFKFQVRTNTGSTDIIAPFTAGQLSTWTHVAGTYDGTMMRLFFDGVEVASGPKTGVISSSTNVLRIGNGDVSNPGAEVWSGNIDEVRIWPFARTADEILATLNTELVAMPPGVVTFNLNGSTTDSSSSLSGTLVGMPVLDANSPSLTSYFSNTVGYGASSSTCGSVRTMVGSLPQVGNTAFRPRALGVTPGASGLFFSSLALLMPSFPLAGVELNIDPTLIRITIPVAPASALGVAEVGAGIPNSAALAGRSYYSQFLILDGVCGGPNLVGSEGLAITIHP